MPRDRDLHKLTRADGPTSLFPRPEFLRLGVLFGLALVITLIIFFWKQDGQHAPSAPLQGPPEVPEPRIEDIAIKVDPWNPPKRRLNSIISSEREEHRRQQEQQQQQ